MKRPKGIKGKLDALMSRLIRERNNWRCERCDTYYPEGKRMGLHWSHYIGRSHMATRWLPNNAFAHCYGCHSYLGSRPHDFRLWAEATLGSGLLEMIEDRGREIVRYRKRDLEEMHAHYKGELARLEAMRMDGHQGYIEVEAWE